MRFVDEFVRKEDKHHCDQADWLDVQEGRVHAIPATPKNRQATSIAPKEELRATHEVKCHSGKSAKDVRPLLPPEHRKPVVVERQEGRGDV